MVSIIRVDGARKQERALRTVLHAGPTLQVRQGSEEGSFVGLRPLEFPLCLRAPRLSLHTPRPQDEAHLRVGRPQPAGQWQVGAGSGRCELRRCRCGTARAAPEGAGFCRHAAPAAPAQSPGCPAYRCGPHCRPPLPSCRPACRPGAALRRVSGQPCNRVVSSYPTKAEFLFWRACKQGRTWPWR